MTNIEYEQAYVMMAKIYAMRKHRDQKRKSFLGVFSGGYG